MTVDQLFPDEDPAQTGSSEPSPQDHTDQARPGSAAVAAWALQQKAIRDFAVGRHGAALDRVVAKSAGLAKQFSAFQAKSDAIAQALAPAMRSARVLNEHFASQSRMVKLDLGSVRWLADALSWMRDEHDEPGAWRHSRNLGVRSHRRRMALALLRFGRQSGPLRVLISASMELPFRDAPAAVCALLGGRTGLCRLLERLEVNGGHGTALWWWVVFALEFLDDLATPLEPAASKRLRARLVIDLYDEIARFLQRKRSPRADDEVRLMEPLVAGISRHGPPARATEGCMRGGWPAAMLVSA